VLGPVRGLLAQTSFETAVSTEVPARVAFYPRDFRQAFDAHVYGRPKLIDIETTPPTPAGIDARRAPTQLAQGGASVRIDEVRNSIDHARFTSGGDKETVLRMFDTVRSPGLDACTSRAVARPLFAASPLAPREASTGSHLPACAVHCKDLECDGAVRCPSGSFVYRGSRRVRPLPR
jgi:hypothetical protein